MRDGHDDHGQRQGTPHRFLRYGVLQLLLTWYQRNNLRFSLGSMRLRIQITHMMTRMAAVQAGIGGCTHRYTFSLISIRSGLITTCISRHDAFASTTLGGYLQKICQLEVDGIDWPDRQNIRCSFKNVAVL